MLRLVEELHLSLQNVVFFWRWVAQLTTQMVEQLESALEAKIRQYKSWRDAPFCGVCKAGTLGLTRWFLDISGSLCC